MHVGEAMYDALWQERGLNFLDVMRSQGTGVKPSINWLVFLMISALLGAQPGQKELA